MLCLLLILSLYSIQNYYPLQTRTLQGFESSCPLLKKDFGKNYCPCPLLKKQLPQKCSSCLLLKKQIKNKYFSCLLFLTTTTAALQPYEILRCPPAYAAIPGAAGTQLGCDHRYAGLSLHLSPSSFYHSFRLFFHWRLFCSTIYPIIVLFYLHEQLAKRPERLELQQVKTAIKSPLTAIKSTLTAIKSTLAGAFVQSSSAKTHYHMTQK